MPVTAFTNLGQNWLAATTLGDVMALVEDDRVEQVDLQGALQPRAPPELRRSRPRRHHRLKKKERNLKN